MKRYIILLTIFLFAITLVRGQNHIDAFRYSQHTIGGTARSVAMGGAFGALGGDFSTLSQNPAGLAVYRKSEFTFTPEIYVNNKTTRYFGNESKENKYNFNFSNLGYVAVFEKENSPIKSVNFGIGYNRIANFHANYEIQGVNNNTSYVDEMVEQANNDGGFNSSYSFFTSALFYDSKLMNYNDSLGKYELSNDEYFYSDGSFRPTQQTVTSTERGKINEWVISLGVNVGDFLYLGGTFGIHSVYFKQKKTFKEIDNNEPTYEYFTFNENLITRGTGYTAKMGAIVRPIQQLRLGAAISLPVFYNLTDTYDTYLTRNGQTYYPKDNSNYRLDELKSNYTVTTPFKATGSIGVILGKFLILSGDFEYLDYSTMKLNSDDWGYDTENDYIESAYDEAYNVRLGAECRLSTFYLRGGFGYYTSPFSADDDTKNYGLSYSGGFGVRDDDMFFDVAFQYSSYSEVSSLYEVTYDDVTYNNEVNTDTNPIRIMTTIGFRF